MKFISPRLLFVLITAISLISTDKVYSQVSRLKVIPEVQFFVASSAGTYTMPAAVSILVKTAETQAKTDSLTMIANQLKDELKQMFNTTATVTPSTATAAAAGEILLMYSPTLRNFESYQMVIADGITIKGMARQGTFWGTRTLLQLVENHLNLVPRGTITDYPHFPSRGFMLDVGRKFFTIEFLRQYVKILSYYKMNEFHVHLNDNGFKQYFGNDWTKTYAAFRLESTTYPGLAAADGHYTKAEFRDLQLLGMQYGVNVIPEIDIPAHSLAFTRFKPELAAKAPYAPDHLELMDETKRPMVYEFFDKLFDEYIKEPNPTFVGPDVHIGTDEYAKEGDIRNVDNEQAKQFRLFTDRYLKYIADLGKTPRLWGGLKWLKDTPETPVTPWGNAVMNSWSVDWVDPVPMLDKGFRIMTTLDSWLYIVPAAGYYKDFLDIQWLYNNFRPEKVNGYQTLPNFQPGLVGATFAVWNDICGNGISQQDVHFRAYPALKVMAAKNWKVTPVLVYADYLKIADASTEGPGLNMIGKYSADKMAEISAKIGSASQVFDGTTEVPLGGTDMGYDYEVSFDLNPASGNNVNAVLFQSYFSKVTLNTNGTQKLGFSRDGYTYTFNYIPVAGTWQNIKISGNYRAVTLYINGERKELLTAYRKTTGLPNNLNFQQTLFFPLEKVGDATNGFKGEMKNLTLAVIDYEKIKADFLATKAQIAPGDYYVKYGDLYWTNNNPGGSGGTPTFSAKLPVGNDSTQFWTITLDAQSSRYKIVNAKDKRYLNELAVFGTNPYYSSWNSYNFYLKNNLYAIQNDGDAGKGVWSFSNNQLTAGPEIYDEGNYILTLVPVNSTKVDELAGMPIKLVQTSSSIQVKGVEVKELTLYSISGKKVRNSVSSDTIRIAGIVQGAYLLKIHTVENKKGTIKVVL